MFIYELIFGSTAFSSDRETLMFQRILYEKLTFPHNIYCTRDGRHLLQRLLSKSVEKRLTDAVKLKKHPWFRELDFNKVYRQEVEAPTIPNCRFVFERMQPVRSRDFEKSSQLLYSDEFADF